jgi:hypothetical protein
MSFKPCRGNRILLDKNIQISQESYFKFWEIHDIKERSKLAYKWYLADKYLNNLGGFFECVRDFIKECKNNKEQVYKPFLKLIENV